MSTSGAYPQFVTRVLTLDNETLRLWKEAVALDRDHWRPYAPSIDSLQSALEMRQRFLSVYEQAEQDHDSARWQALMTCVIVGAGPAIATQRASR